MKKPIVIGIVAPKEAGKSTTTNMIAEFVDSKETSFAGKLKDACAEAFNIPRNHFDDQNLKEVVFETPMLLTELRIISILMHYVDHDLIGTIKYQHLIDKPLNSPRHIAQIVGTELLRDCVSQTVHIDHVSIYPDKVTVVSDTRFENEYEVMKNRTDIQYYAAYIYRKTAEDVARLSTHPSETEFFKFKDKCYLLDNNGDLRELESNVKKFIDSVLFGE